MEYEINNNFIDTRSHDYDKKRMKNSTIIRHAVMLLPRF